MRPYRAKDVPILYSFAIGIVGDAGVRGTAQQPRLFVGMILILIFAEVLGKASFLLPKIEPFEALLITFFQDCTVLLSRS